MKRDMDLVREILRRVESYEDSWGMPSPEIDGYTEAQIAYHLRLLLQGGLIEVKTIAEEFGEEDQYHGINLTMDGQDFVSASRDSSLWKKAKEQVMNTGVTFTVQSLLAWLKAQALVLLGSS